MERSSGMGEFYLISGDDDFARKQRAHQAAVTLCGENEPENSPALEIITSDSPDAKPEELLSRFLEALRTPPFLNDFKVVWLRHYPALDELFSDAPPAGAAEILTILSSPLEDYLKIIIDGPGVDRRKKAVKDLKNSGVQIEIFNTAKSSDKGFAENRRQVLDNFARSCGKRLRHDAMQYLLEVLGGDSGMLANELEKLDCFTAGQTEITLEDCLAITSRTAEALTWEFTGAVIAGNRSTALKTLAMLLGQRENGMEIRLLYALSNEYQRLIQTKLAMKQLRITRPAPGVFDNISPELKEQFPGNPLLKMHPFRAFKVCESCMKVSGATLAEKLKLIRDASLALVTGGGDSRMVLEALTCSLCDR